MFELVLEVVGQVFDLGSGLSSPQSIADYLVTSMKPNVEYVTKRMGSLKLKSRIIRLFPRQEPIDLMSYVAKSNSDLIASMDSVPEWFNADQYTSLMSEAIKQLLTRDQDLREAVHYLEKNSGIEQRESVLSYQEAFKALATEIRTLYLDYELELSKMFLTSDMPNDYFYFLKKGHTSLVSELDALYRKSIGFETKLHIARGFNGVKYAAYQYRGETAPLIVAGRIVSDSLSKLEIYVSLCNASSVEEMFRTRPLNIQRMDKEKFASHMNDLVSSVREIERELYSLNFTYRPFELSESAKELQTSLSSVLIA